VCLGCLTTSQKVLFLFSSGRSVLPCTFLVPNPSLLVNKTIIISSSRSYDFTPLDSSAVYVLSNMARQRRTSQSSGGAVSPDCDKFERSGSPQSSHAKSGRSLAQVAPSTATPVRCKRPMNAFMLFAKKYRVEYTQMYPGKDNRCVFFF